MNVFMHTTLIVIGLVLAMSQVAIFEYDSVGYTILWLAGFVVGANVAALIARRQ